MHPSRVSFCLAEGAHHLFDDGLPHSLSEILDSLSRSVTTTLGAAKFVPIWLVSAESSFISMGDYDYDYGCQ